ncbi:bifunctional proline dehydrogenase/L-glutamate gamma-semialdehyde dehydrogenase PutA [Oleiagrimonas citrea]|uniref:bifunctional proline dehydrogenase/L-glutamate gamma-semialdehyde dehydrogenase PutA n=1 Tax=Oleiagrimonas citrea TaxID=1665687 RepID=UPI003083F9CA
MNAQILSPELVDVDQPARQRITEAWLRDESETVQALLAEAELPEAERKQIIERATNLVLRVRERADDQDAIEAFMRQYDLSSEEGVLLMCVAEALLRIPDTDTIDMLIRDKLGDADWQKHLGGSHSVLVNASTWGLMLTGRMVQMAEDTRTDVRGAMRRLAGRAGEPMIRAAVHQAMRIMGKQFVMGRRIDEAVERADKKANRPYRYSFDMLGEAALTQPDAERYQQAYRNAIVALGKDPDAGNLIEAPSISVKLSALHPRYEHGKRERVLVELTEKVLELAQMAKEQGIALTIDAEEADRLELSLDVAAEVFAHPSLEGWDGLGMAVQAYQKRAPAVIDWLADMARRHKRRWFVRLVKGAYWDTEIKRAQELGFTGYPVYTRKPNTDVAYLACAKRLLDVGADLIYPQFATHNAHTIAYVHHIAEGRPYEFQRLHGMGEDLYAEVIGKNKLNVPCRVYAPVGSHEDLLPYLVRRLLENGANTSFVNRIFDEDVSIDELVADPCETVRGFKTFNHPRIPMPVDIYGEQRKNSMGVNFSNEDDIRQLAEDINAHKGPWKAAPLVPGAKIGKETVKVTDPADHRRVVGEWIGGDESVVDTAITNAVAAQPDWDRVPAEKRAQIAERAAEMIEANRGEFVAMCVREAGKTLPDAIAEVREAADFCRYYAGMARKLFGQPEDMPSPTGETNRLFLNGRGVFVCISPWNFPLAIFMGEVMAAVLAGNTVVAKPAEQTSLIGYAAVKLLHEAGIPQHVLQFIPGDGASVGAALTRDPRIAGVAFTGSTETAWVINKTLAARKGPIATLIAETGGQNAMIADSSSLPEQLVKDVMASAFGSAGQRCSAARILFIQDDVADRVIEMLGGAIDELKVGDPGLLSTDVGPVIDHEALEGLQKHVDRMNREAKLIRKATVDAEVAEHGTFLAPHAFEIPSLDMLEREEFGPILHVVRWKAGELDKVLDQINATGYGLTLGIHSRIDDTIAYVQKHARVGNCYANRNQVGAVVGVQPFGGEGLSGTGFKAGGPHYMLRFATERVLTVNTTAAGGNASLMMLGD